MILGIDPGTRKVGFALIDERGAVLAQGIEEVGRLADRVTRLRDELDVHEIALGRGTNAEHIRQALDGMGLEVTLVDEHETTLRARRLYFADHPPRGWRRLIPLGMQLPPRPIDDYAAVLIARRHMANRGPAR